MIKLINVGKTYGEGDSAIVALKGINLTLPQGKFISIVGKSGSGKSTILNIIGALDVASEGTVECNDICVTALKGRALSQYRLTKIGFIFQAFHLEPKFTVLENVEMPLVIAGVDKKIYREKAKEIIAKLGLSDKINQKAGNLSGGQKQRVSIARALINEPEIILADEPTGNLDVKNAQEVMSFLREITNDGRIVILVTHNLDDAMKADIMIEIVDGEVAKITESEGIHEV